MIPIELILIGQYAQVQSGQRTELHKLAYAGNNTKIGIILSGAAPGELRVLLNGDERQACIAGTLHKILDVQQEHGFTPLIDATSNENHTASAETVRLLLDAGATPGIVDNEGYTAAHWAAACDNLEALKVTCC